MIRMDAYHVKLHDKAADHWSAAFFVFGKSRLTEKSFRDDHWVIEAAGSHHSPSRFDKRPVRMTSIQ